MIENVLNHIGGVGVFGVISICMFFAFFTGMIWWAIRLKSTYVTTMQSLPMDDGTAKPQSSSRPGCDQHTSGNPVDQ